MNPTNQITVIGIGRLGICLALCLEKAGYHVLGVDLSENYIDQINKKILVSPEPLISEYLKNSQNFRATTSFQEGLDFSDTYFIAAPTNTVPDIQSYDHSILSNILTKMNAQAVANKHIIISATVFPGYITNTALPLIANCPNTTISYNPEFIAQGNIIKGLSYPDMVLIGEGSPIAGDQLESIYNKLCNNHPHIARMSVPSAEITKLAVNCFITAKIAFANLIGDIADETPGADKEAITKAIGQDKRVGTKNMKPGFGYGGPCFPRDNRALGNYASVIGIDPLFFQTTDQTNDTHATYMAKKLAKKNLKTYIFENVCYKPDCSVPIIENSQKLVVAKKLTELGKEVVISDTEVIIQKVKEVFLNQFKYSVKK
jgi:UDPglucose 6-dehydrogenase